MKPREYLSKTADESMSVKKKFMDECSDLLIAASEALGKCIRSGGKVLIFGNGGSAADAQHMAAEMVGKLMVDRKPLPAIALTTDSSNITALGNDFGFEHVFSKQVQALACKGDIVIAISTSGNSKNVLAAVEEARKTGCKVIGMTGGSGGKLKTLSDICLNASLGTNSSRIQETHIFAIHTMVDLLDRFYLEV